MTWFSMPGVFYFTEQRGLFFFARETGRDTESSRIACKHDACLCNAMDVATLLSFFWVDVLDIQTEYSKII